MSKQEQKFKVGDTIQVRKMFMMPQLEIRSVADGWITVEPTGMRFHVDEVELVSSEADAAPSDLEALVRKANEGQEAERILRAKHRENVDVRNFYLSGMAGGWNPLQAAAVYEFRVKPAPELFKSFKLQDSNHKVVIDRGGAAVGCVLFDDVSVLRAVLKGFLDGATTSSLDLTPSRQGLRHRQGEMTWADAEQLLAVLETIK